MPHTHPGRGSGLFQAWDLRSGTFRASRGPRVSSPVSPREDFLCFCSTYFCKVGGAPAMPSLWTFTLDLIPAPRMILVAER